MRDLEQQNKIEYPHRFVTILIIFGYRDEKEKLTPIASIQVRKEHLYLHCGWELKDVVIIGLPQNLRFCILRDYEKVENSKGIFYAFYCKKE